MSNVHLPMFPSEVTNCYRYAIVSADYMGKDIHTDSLHFTVTVTTVGGIFAWGSYTVLQNSVLSCVTVFFWFRL